MNWFELRLQAAGVQGLFHILRGRPDKSVAVAEDTVGLRAADYRSEEALRRRVAAFRARTNPKRARDWLLTTAQGVAMNGRSADALALYHVVLDVPDDIRRDPRRLVGHLGETLADDAKLYMSTLSYLAMLFEGQGRSSEAAELLRVDLESIPVAADLRDPDDVFEARLRRRLDGLDRLSAAVYLATVTQFVDAVAPSPTGVVALERAFGLQPGDYASPAALKRKLDPWASGTGVLTGPANGTAALFGLTGGLFKAGRNSEAVALVEWWLDATATDYADTTLLAAKWRAFRSRLVGVPVLSLLSVWAEALALDGRHQDALAVIAADNDVVVDVIEDTTKLLAMLERRFTPPRPDTAEAAYVAVVFATMVASERTDAAGAIATWFIPRHELLWSPRPGGDPDVHRIVALLDFWLTVVDHDDPEYTWTVCRQAVAYLRTSVAMDVMHRLVDRRAFITDVESLRTTIGTVADRVSSAGHDEQRLIEALLWDAELGQRALFEEFLLVTVAPTVEGTDPEERWPLPGPEPHFDSHLPDPDACRDHDVLSILAAADRRASTSRAPIETRSPESTAVPPEKWLTEAEGVVREGVTQDLLAKILGRNGMLLRAGFHTDGALAWTAVRSDGTALRVCGSYVGTPGDRTRLRWARVRYEACGLLAAADRGLAVPQEPDGEVWTPAGYLARALGRLARSLTEAIAIDARRRAWKQHVDAALADLAASSVAVRERLDERLRDLLEPDPTPALATELAALAALVAESQAHAGDGGFARIDTDTARYLDDVARLWPLDALAEHLDDDLDVVFQLEDTLQSFPIAHHTLGDGVPLYARVRSTRVSLSILVTVMQDRVERESGSNATDLLTLSHFEPDDSAAQFAQWLHHGQRRLAAGAVTCLSAAIDPEGSASTLGAALARGTGFAAVTVCGHGHAREAAIELADGLWNGTGVDWRGVDLLVLVSCSVGVLDQAEDQDVEGLCVRLAVHRARGVLACRRPVVAPHAIAFANEVVARYLDLRGDHDAGPLLRARAVNAARRHFLGRGNTPVEGRMVRLDTVAAFELYGLG
ncbi:hypothetical protein ACIBSV_43065 [Embleya sp. NPDC050154]|uniref:hypothetical protein n=1 Tax=Embleya sp. NPDC050154 TaxID=3363988 RepID=UPI0037A21648